MPAPEPQPDPPTARRFTRKPGPNTKAALRLTLRLDVAGRPTLGPGKARLLELIGETGSISAAGRAMGMSYRRAWTLVESLNASFAAPSSPPGPAAPVAAARRCCRPARRSSACIARWNGTLRARAPRSWPGCKPCWPRRPNTGSPLG